jgi:hypothetical protein
MHQLVRCRNVRKLESMPPIYALTVNMHLMSQLTLFYVAKLSTDEFPGQTASVAVRASVWSDYLRQARISGEGAGAEIVYISGEPAGSSQSLMRRLATYFSHSCPCRDLCLGQEV